MSRLASQKDSVVSLKPNKSAREGRLRDAGGSVSGVQEADLAGRYVVHRSHDLELAPFDQLGEHGAGPVTAPGCHR